MCRSMILSAGLAGMMLAGAVSALPAAGGYSADPEPLRGRRRSRHIRCSGPRLHREPHTEAEWALVVLANRKRARRRLRNIRIHHRKETP